MVSKMMMVASFMKDKVRMMQKGEKGDAARIEFLQTIKYDAQLQNMASKIVNNIESYPKTGYGELSILCDKYGSDKGSCVNVASNKIHPYSWMPHSYTDVYEALFSDIRHDVKNVFECGIGTSDETIVGNMSKTGKPGASLRVWQDFFTNADIWGADIDEKILFEEERIKTGWIDQTSPEAIKAFFESTNKGLAGFDIMIDDGLHQAPAAICLFENAINYLAQDGIYVIEDLLLTDVNKVREYFANKRQFVVKYAVMSTFQLFNNNMIIIRKL